MRCSHPKDCARRTDEGKPGLTVTECEDDFDRFRNYLRLLAELQLDGPLRRKVDPSDIVQRTLLEAYRSRGAFRGRGEEERAAWLRVILSNVVLQVARKLRTQKRDVDREVSLDTLASRTSRQLEACLVAAGGSPSECAMREERVMALADALDGLSDEQRRVVLFHHCEGLSMMEIAAELDRTRASVAGLLRRGLKILRERLSRETLL